jgi:hypothetical protein
MSAKSARETMYDNETNVYDKPPTGAPPVPLIEVYQSPHAQ